MEPEGVVKFQVENQKWVGLEDLDVGSKFLMFSKRICFFKKYFWVFEALGSATTYHRKNEIQP